MEGKNKTKQTSRGIRAGVEYIYTHVYATKIHQTKERIAHKYGQRKQEEEQSQLKDTLGFFFPTRRQNETSRLPLFWILEFTPRRSEKLQSTALSWDSSMCLFVGFPRSLPLFHCIAVSPEGTQVM